MAQVSGESSSGHSTSIELITKTTNLVPIAADSVHQQSENVTNNQPLPTPRQQQLPEAPTISQQQPKARYKYPDRELLEGDRKTYIRICVPLYEASIKGDWGAAFNILQDHEYMVRNSITENWETPLHIAATAHSTKFLKNLVGMMNEDDMKLQNKQGNTALILAAEAGNVKLAKIMVEKNRELLTIRGTRNMMPIHLAALFGKRDMVIYLYDESEQMSSADRNDMVWIFLQCIEVDIFDVALRILEDHKDKMLFKDEALRSLLQVLGRKPYAFYDIKPHAIWRTIHSITRVKMGHATKKSDATQLLRIIWEQIAVLPKKEIYEILRGPMIEVEKTNTYPSRILFIAAELGNTQFLIELIRLYPDLIWKKDDSSRTIFHIAVSYRHESIYNLLYEIGSMKDMITPLTDHQGNNMLHLVGISAENDPLEDVSGAAFQMQRELLWYKVKLIEQKQNCYPNCLVTYKGIAEKAYIVLCHEVEAMLPPSHRKQKNKAGKTPHEVFVKNHKELVTQGEKWMKETANQSMVVAALITTVVFAAAFTIPGGYNQNTGHPIFQKNGPFIVFVMLDAISLILASVSILMFLSILTSRYARDDFLESLPKKLLIGLTTLFLSIITMMVSFSVSFFVLYHNKYISIPIVISVIAIIPASLYAKLQYPLLIDVYRATYSSKYLFKPKKSILYYRIPSF